MNDDEIADIWETIFVDKWGEIKVSEWNLYKKFARAIAEKEREECAKICFEFPDVGYVKAILTCDYHSYLINKRGTKMSAIPISQMANDILKIIEEVALDYPEEEREELKAVMLGQLGLAMFNRPMGDKNE